MLLGNISKRWTWPASADYDKTCNKSIKLLLFEPGVFTLLQVAESNSLSGFINKVLLEHGHPPSPVAEFAQL